MRGVRPIATSTFSAVTGSPSDSVRTALSPSRVTSVTSTPSRIVTPSARRESVTSSPAKGSMFVSSPERTSSVTSVPNPAYAVAISTPTTPPPMMASDAGTSWALVASRLVHGSMSASPGMSGSSAAEPVAATTAWVAVRRVTVPSAAVTVSAFTPVNSAWPRMRSMPAFATHFTCDESSQSWVIVLRRRSTPATSTLPVTACFAPSTACAARTAAALRSSALLGMHAQ